MNISGMITRIFQLMEPRSKRQFYILITMAFGLSLIEVVGIASILPFISIANDPATMLSNENWSWFFSRFQFLETESLLFTMGYLLIAFYIFRFVAHIAFTYLLNRFAMGSYKVFSRKLFENYLDLKFVKLSEKNTSKMAKAIVTESQELGGVLSGFVNLLTEILVTLCFYGFLLFVDYKITLMATVFIGFMLLVVFKTISKRVVQAGKTRNTFQEGIYKTTFDTLNNMRVIKLMGDRNLLVDKLRQTAESFSKTYIFYHTSRNVPRYLLETSGFTLVVFIVLYILKFYDDPSAILSTLGAFAIALYRLLPSASRMAMAYNQILFHKKSLEIIEEELQGEVEIVENTHLDFNNSIELQNVSFSYADKPVIKNVNLKIEKGKKVGFIGPSGAGKSTLVDLLTGLIPPDSGQLAIDGEDISNNKVGAWRKKTGYIPQSIFLFDGSAGENISFGRSPDNSELQKVLKAANLEEFLSEKQGFDTIVGDFGGKLSGGQRQRIGIARALYGSPEVLVLDEATSSLDKENAELIMNQILSSSQGKTVLAIVHDKNLLKDFDEIYEVKDYMVSRV